MFLTTWLATRVSEDEHSTLEFAKLYEVYSFEMKENGDTACTKKTLGAYLTKMFPNSVKERNTHSSTDTIYSGLRLNPLGTLRKHFSQLNESDFERLGEMLKSLGVLAKQASSTSIICPISSGCTSNGNEVLKELYFQRDGKWTLNISKKEVPLSELMIDNEYCLEQESIKGIIQIVRCISLCGGVKVTQNVSCSRFHILENFSQSGASSVRVLRSLLCTKAVSLLSKTGTCIKCQRMTITNSNPKCNLEQADKPDKENKSEKEITVTVEELLNMMPGATIEMAELIQHQIINLSKKPSARRWSQTMINTCLKWYCRSPQSYEEFRQSKNLILPSKTLLLVYKNKVKQSAGFDDELMEWMAAEAKRRNLPEEGYIGGLIQDEMAIQSDLQICKNGDVVELSGLVEVGQEGYACQVLRAAKNEPKLGTHVLQLVFLGSTGFRFPFAHFVTDGIQAPQLYSIFWDAVSKLRIFGFSALYTCMDGAQSNRTFMRMHINDNKNFTTTSPCSFKPMTFLMDPSHVIKKIKNNVIKSGNKDQHTRLLILPSGNDVHWQMFIDCYYWDKKNGLNLHHRLSNEHLFPSNQSKMRNHLAEQVLDAEMLNLMSEYRKSLGEKGACLEGATELLQKTSSLINIFHDFRPIKSMEDERIPRLLDLANWFEQWEKNSKKLPKSKVQTMSVQCHEDILSCTRGFCQMCEHFFKVSKSVYVTPALVNSDIIENTFNQQRSTYHGANANPNALQYRSALNSIIIGQNTISTKANAGKSRDGANTYDCDQQSKPLKRKVLCDKKRNEKIKVLRM